MTKVKAIIQARMSSRRLPGKVLLPLGDDVVLGHVIRRLIKCSLIDEVLVATSGHASDDPIEKYCDAREVRCFRGDLDDVLARYYFAATEASCDHVVRITADCPLIDPIIVDAVVMGHLAGGYDYFGLGGDFPDGLDCAVLSYSALKRTHEEATLHSDREHVCPFIERGADATFKVGYLKLFYGMQSLRLTLDEREDYELLSHLFDVAFANEQPNAAEVISYLQSESWVGKINSHIIRNEGYLHSLERDSN